MLTIILVRKGTGDELRPCFNPGIYLGEEGTGLGGGGKVLGTLGYGGGNEITTGGLGFRGEGGGVAAGVVPVTVPFVSGNIPVMAVRSVQSW
jgi:hypothetical protein